MKAIQTKYLPATNYKSSRIKAMAEGVKPVFLPYDSEYSDEENHRIAAFSLCGKYDWPKNLVSGFLPDGSMAHCFEEKV